MFFDENGILDLDGMVCESPSFKKIMEDGLVTEEELKEQSDKIIGILHDMEKQYCEEELRAIKNLLVETSVLYAAYQQFSIQSTR